MTDPRNPHTKPEAVAFVSAVMRTPHALLSPDFQVAMDLSMRFEISARDVLEFRKSVVAR